MKEATTLAIGQKELEVLFPRTGVGDLERMIGNLGRARPDAESNYDAMCSAISEGGIITRECEACGGVRRGKEKRPGNGFRELAPRELARWNRKIANQPDAAGRARIRAEMFEETICQVCQGAGFVSSESKLQSTPCDLCHGMPGLSCKRCFGAGRVFLGFIDSMFTTVGCGRCRGSGEVEDEESEDVCPLCRGATYNIPCTVRSTGSSKGGKLPPGTGGNADASEGATTHHAEHYRGALAWADEQEVADLGATSRLLEGVRRVDPAAALALETYHGDVGGKWSRHHWGRSFALWPLTKSGAQVVRDALARDTVETRIAGGAGALMTPDAILALERAAEGRCKVANLRRRALLRKADEEHRELLARARRILAEVAAA
jgi:hypothetical protein